MAHKAELVADAPTVEALFDEHWVSAWRAAYAVTGRTYRLTKHDAGHRLRLRVTALNVAGSTSATSRPTARVPRRR